MNNHKIAIIGAGAVGATTAYALMLKNIGSEIILVDVDEKRCTGEILDLSDVLPISTVNTIKKGSLDDASTSDIIIIAAGKRQEIGQSRLDLWQENKKIVSDICGKLQNIQKNAIVIVVTNPVDPLSLLLKNSLPLHHNKIFSTGTLLDTERLKKFLGFHFKINPESIITNVLGEHGESQFVQWSGTHINTAPISTFKNFNEKMQHEFALKVKNEAAGIIQCKGATYFGIATYVALVCEIIMYDKKVVLPLSCYQEKDNVYVSVPVVLGNEGILEYVPLILSKEEQEMMQKSMSYLKNIE